jgi:hypothetical protein
MACSSHVLGYLFGRLLFSPPFHSLLSPNPEKVSTETPALWLKTIGPIPYSGKGFLRNILGSLRASDQLSQERLQTMSILAIERIECQRIAL